MAVLLRRQIKWARNVNVRLADDKYDPDITGCVVMSSGYIVACDRNGSIKLLDRYWSLLDSLKLPANPWDVAVIDDNNVIVTIPHKQQLQYIQVFPQLNLGPVIQLNKWCWGVAVSGEEIYITCDTIDGHSSYTNDGDVRVLDKQGNLKRRYGIHESGSYLMHRPFHITVSSSGDKLYVSDASVNTVTCFNVCDGSVFFMYKHSDLRNPRGLYCDDRDNVIVCGHASNNIHVITADGNNGNLLSSKDGIMRPESVAYRESDDTFVIGCFKSDQMIIFRLSN